MFSTRCTPNIKKIKRWTRSSELGLMNESWLIEKDAHTLPSICHYLVHPCCPFHRRPEPGKWVPLERSYRRHCYRSRCYRGRCNPLEATQVYRSLPPECRPLPPECHSLTPGSPPRGRVGLKVPGEGTKWAMGLNHCRCLKCFWQFWNTESRIWLHRQYLQSFSSLQVCLWFSTLRS